MIPPGWALIPATALSALAGVIVANEGGVVLGAIIAGVFMLVNSVLTVWITNRLVRGRRDEDRPRNHKR